MEIKDEKFVEIVKKYISIKVTNNENKKKLENMVQELYNYHNSKLEQVSEESKKDEKERIKNLILKIESDIDSLEMGDGNLTSYDEAWDALKTNSKDIN